MIVITGPRTITLIDRLKRLFYENESLGIRFHSKETTLEINGVNISAYPSNHLDSARVLITPHAIFWTRQTAP